MPWFPAGREQERIPGDADCAARSARCLHCRRRRHRFLVRGRAQCFGEAATIVGTPGDDTLTGTDNDEVLVGLGGNDTITGGGGFDLICPGDGNDVVSQSAGSYIGIAGVSGDLGDDTIQGGRDVIMIIDYEESPVPVHIDLGVGTATGLGNDTLTSVDFANGSPFVAAPDATRSTTATRRGSSSSAWHAERPAARAAITSEESSSSRARSTRISSSGAPGRTRSPAARAMTASTAGAAAIASPAGPARIARTAGPDVTCAVPRRPSTAPDAPPTLIGGLDET
jgi:hypothetical protein